MQSRNLAEDYIGGLLRVLESADGINAAIDNRNVLKPINNEKSNLATRSDLFNEAGNISNRATLTFHDRERFDRELKLFAIPDTLSDREKIAFVAVYFEVGSGLITPNDIFKNAVLEALQIIVAHEVAKNVGFETPTGYIPREKLLRKFHHCLRHSFEISQHAVAMVGVKDELKMIAGELIHFRQQASQRTRFSIFPVLNAEQLKYLHGIASALEEFNSSHNFLRLSCFVRDLNIVCKKHGLGYYNTHRFQPVLQQLNHLVMRHERNLYYTTDKKSALNVTLTSHANAMQSIEQLPDFGIRESNKISASKRFV